jgi:hypothetical protein
MPTPTFTLSFGSLQLPVSSLLCNASTYPEYNPILLPGWTAIGCSASPLLINSTVIVAHVGEANRTLLITAITPTVAVQTTVASTSTTIQNATETIAIKNLLEPWLTPGFFNLLMAFMLLCLFWGGFASGSRTAGRGF